VEVCTLGPETIALYALNALGKDESDSFERHLSCCRKCRGKLKNKSAFRETMLAYIKPEIDAASRRAPGHWNHIHSKRCPVHRRH
jgi:hypothetical protein